MVGNHDVRKLFFGQGYKLEDPNNADHQHHQVDSRFIANAPARRPKFFKFVLYIF